MLKVRSRFGARLVPAKELLADFIRRRGVVRAIGMNSDQAPVSTDQRYWTVFLGQDTAFYIGADQIARAMRLGGVLCGEAPQARAERWSRIAAGWSGRPYALPVVKFRARALGADTASVLDGVSARC